MKKYFKYSQNELDYLSKKDKKLAFVIKKVGMIKREITTNLFEGLVRSIIAQQISTKAQKSIFERLKNKIQIINSTNILNLSDNELQSIGISFKKVQYIKNIAKNMNEKKLENLKNLSDEEVCEELTKLKGIGIWSAQMLMIFSQERKNIISFLDLGIQRGLKMLYNHKEITPKLCEKYKKRYSPYASIASLYLWEVAGLNVDLREKTMDDCAFYDTKFGKIKICYNEKAITYVAFCEQESISKKSKLSDEACRQLNEYFEGKRKSFDLPLEPKGTDFQKKVWQELTQIPYSQTRSYKEIATQIGNPKASRAVGGANNKNPIAIIIPCHRVIGSSGKLVGYASGLKHKEKLLALESQN